jgi:hypothetical protein
MKSVELKKVQTEFIIYEILKEYMKHEEIITKLKEISQNYNVV